jgi:RHS repeat-associated protein
MAITVGPPTPAARALYFIHADHLNTPRLVADAAGTTVWQWDQQEPFGSNPADENPSGFGAFDLPLRFGGQEHDAETGLHYNYFRDYDASIGRYVESDPIGLLGGINTYAYVRNTPITNLDMLGLMGSRGNQTYGCGSGASQPWVPNNPLGYPFLDCCNDHDRCYDDCINKPSRAQCDSTFCSCVASKCYRYARGQKRQCESLARTYCEMVTQYGEDAFDKARSKCAVCK